MSPGVQMREDEKEEEGVKVKTIELEAEWRCVLTATMEQLALSVSCSFGVSCLRLGLADRQRFCR
jgi:hypothetical protein